MRFKMLIVVFRYALARCMVFGVATAFFCQDVSAQAYQRLRRNETYNECEQIARGPSDYCPKPIPCLPVPQ